MQRNIGLVLGTVIVCLGLAVGGLRFQPAPWSVDIDVGNEGPFLTEGQTVTFQNFFGFYDSEIWRGDYRDFRWTQGRATVTVPYALRAQPLAVDIVACTCLPDTTRDVTLLLNNSTVTTLTVTDQWQRYRVLVPPHLTHPDYGVMVELRSPVSAATADDGRALGIAVDRITLYQARPLPLADLASILAVLVGVVYLSWWQRSLVLPIVLGGSWLLVNYLYQPQLLPRWVLSAALVAGLIGLWRVSVVKLWLRGEQFQLTNRLIAALLLALLAMWLTLSPQVLGAWIADDAFISFRYARNLINGQGLVFNPGERVEGYTNFLWTVSIAGAMAPGSDPVLVVATLTLILAFVICILTLVLAQRFVPAAWAWVAPALLAVSSPFLIYTSRGSGMETALFTALLLAALIAMINHAWIPAAIFTALLMMTRPDGIILASVGGIYALVVGWRAQPMRMRPAIVYGTTLVAIFGPYFLWRWTYYGYLLPNTFYVKVGSTWAQVVRGGEYLWDFGCDTLLVPVGVGGAVLGIWFWRRDRQTRWLEVGLIGAFVALFGLYIVAVGGDWMPGVRFGMPLLPLLAILGVWGIAGLARYAILTRALAAVLVAGLIVLSGLRLPQDSLYQRDSPILERATWGVRLREVGRWINAHTPPDTLIAVAAAGAIPYYADRPAIDVFGLNDTYIAHLDVPDIGTGDAGHEKTDPAYVLSRAPDIIPWSAARDLEGQPELEVHYRLERFDGPEGRAFLLYIRQKPDVSRIER